MTEPACAPAEALDRLPASAAIFRERMEALYARLGLRSLSYLASGVLLSVGLRQAHSARTVLAWLAGVALLQGARAGLLVALHRRARRTGNMRPLAAAFLLTTLVVGCYWGISGALLVEPGAMQIQAYLAMALGGLAAGSVSLHVYYPPVLYTHACVLMFPFAARVAGLGDLYHVYIALGMLLLLGYLIAHGRSAARDVLRLIELRHQNARLIAQLNHQREQAETAHRAKSQLLATASHDLSQPLQALGLWASMLHSGRSGLPVEEVARNISACVRALSELFDGVLELSRIEAGRVEIRPSRFPVAHVLDTAALLFGGEALEKDLSLKRYPSRLWVEADPVVLQRLLGNLVANAVRYTTSGRVVLGARGRSGRVRLLVADTGPGLSGEDVPKVFEEFYRPPGSPGRGFGLGLATVKRLCERAGYDFGVCAKPAVGSQFWVEVPRAQPQAPPREAKEEEGRGTREGQGEVLLVEDDDAARHALELVLRGWGYGCRGVGSFVQALETFSAAPQLWDLVITDLDLGRGPDGIALSERLRTLRERSLHVVIVSGAMTATEEARARAAGCIPLRKPVPPLRLRAVVTHCVSRHPAEPVV